MKTFTQFTESSNQSGITAAGLVRRGAIDSVPGDPVALRAKLQQGITACNNRIAALKKQRTNDQDEYDRIKEDIPWEEQNIDFIKDVLAELK